MELRHLLQACRNQVSSPVQSNLTEISYYFHAFQYFIPLKRAIPPYPQLPMLQSHQFPGFSPMSIPGYTVWFFLKLK